MHIELFPLDLEDAGGFLVPKDEHLHALAEEYFKNELSERPDRKNYRKMWLVCVCDKNRVPERAIGVVGFNFKVDIGLLRVSEPATAKKAFHKIHERLNNYFADQDMRGQQVFMYLASEEPEETRCPLWKEALEEHGARPADRYVFEVR